jgi:quercetin dioxygenase-like cupin family protein
MVSGSAEPGVNRIVSGPPAAASSSLPQLTNRVYPLRIPLPLEEETGWKPYPIFHGSTADVHDLSCHASVLRQHHSPHPPHRHREEELLLLLAGEVDLLLPDDQTAGDSRRRRLKAGQCVYYPASFAHTLETTSEAPAHYLMFRWQADSLMPSSTLAFGRFELFDPAEREVKPGFQWRLVFEGPTAQLGKLNCHASTLTPGAGYEPHVDAYDVAIVVLEGEVESLGERVGPHGVIFSPAGQPHGLGNPGDTVARYVVFEFHGSRTVLAAALPRPPRSFSSKLRDPAAWKRKLKHLWGRVRERAGR